MIKLLFMSQVELSQNLETIMRKKEGMTLSCKISYSEELQTDVASIISNNELLKDIPIQEFVYDLSQQHKVNIISYDVFEVGDHGEGFAFQIV